MNKKSLTYYCKELNCNNKICKKTAIKGQGRCKSCSRKSIRHYLYNKHLSEETKKKMSDSRKIYDNILTKEFLIREYTDNKKSAHKIAEEIGCSSTPIHYKLEEYGIRKINFNKGTSNPNCGNFKYNITKEFLIKEYLNNKKSAIKISKEIGCSRATIENYLHKYNIRIRTNTESHSGRLNHMHGKVTHGKWGTYKGIKMRSSYEVKFTQFLDLSGIEWEYESKTFDLGNSTYTPDFYLSKWNCYIEIKGFWREKGKKKFDLFKKLYPNKNIKVLMKPELQKLGIQL